MLHALLTKKTICGVNLCRNVTFFTKSETKKGSGKGNVCILCRWYKKIKVVLLAHLLSVFGISLHNPHVYPGI